MTRAGGPGRLGLGTALHGPFRLLWVGQSVSLLGDGVFLVAFTWQVAVVWHQPRLLGALLGVRIVAELIALGLTGWIVDRLPRRTILLAADGGRALILFGLAASMHGGERGVWLGVLMTGYGLLAGLFRPTLVAYLPEVTDRSNLTAANALVALSAQVSLVAGPAVGTGLVGLGSTTSALCLDGVSFVVACCCTLPLPRRAPTRSATSPFAQAVEGFRTVRRVGWIGGTILLFSLANLGMIAAERLALPRAAEDRYGQLGGYGTILVAMGVGAILAALVAAETSPPRRPGRTAYTAILLPSLAMAALGLVKGIGAAAVLGLVFGFGQQLFELLWITGLQQHVPGRLLGRVCAADQFGSFMFLPASFAFGGIAVQSLDPEVVMVVAGGVGALLALVGLLVPALHEWRRLDEDALQADGPASGAARVRPAPHRMPWPGGGLRPSGQDLAARQAPRGSGERLPAEQRPSRDGR
jgi:MFS family permease